MNKAEYLDVANLTLISSALQQLGEVVPWDGSPFSATEIQEVERALTHIHKKLSRQVCGEVDES